MSRSFVLGSEISPSQKEQRTPHFTLEVTALHGKVKVMLFLCTPYKYRRAVEEQLLSLASALHGPPWVAKKNVTGLAWSEISNTKTDNETVIYR
jgi:hypothetical protein